MTDSEYKAAKRFYFAKCDEQKAIAHEIANERKKLNFRQRDYYKHLCKEYQRCIDEITAIKKVIKSEDREREIKSFERMMRQNYNKFRGAI